MGGSIRMLRHFNNNLTIRKSNQIVNGEHKSKIRGGEIGLPTNTFFYPFLEF